MTQHFEAGGYDEAMDNWVGRYMRARSIELLMELSAPGDRVLDMGCGTGVEAEALSRSGRTVIAFDPSPSMVDASKERSPEATVVLGSIEGLERLSSENGWHDMDLIYSSFGPINCVKDWRSVLSDSSALLRDGGAMVISVMNRYPALEVAALLLSFRFRKARERTRHTQVVNVGGIGFTAYYRTVGEILRAVPADLRVEKIMALPLLLPPVRVARGPGCRANGILLAMDRALSGRYPFNRFGDHVHIVMRKVGRGG